MICTHRPKQITNLLRLKAVVESNSICVGIDHHHVFGSVRWNDF
jgi:hypothetical protein